MYNIKTNQCDQSFIKFAEEIESSHHTACFNADTNEIYFYGTKKILFGFNINTKECKKYNSTSNPYCGAVPGTIIVNNELLFGLTKIVNSDLY